MKVTRTRNYLLLKNVAKRVLPGHRPGPEPIDDSKTSSKRRVPPLIMDWPQEVAKPTVGLVPDVDSYPYWTHYRRFLQVNEIPFELYDIHRSDWRTRGQDYDLILWRPMSYPYELEECRRKFWILEQQLGKLCYPSLKEVLIYEDKALQYELLDELGFPAVPTFVSHSEAEALAYAATCTYPAVWKIGCGSGSLGVELIRDRHSAERQIRRVFGHSGRRTYWPYLAQKNNVYLQPLEPSAGYDLRVIVIGDHLMGYYRQVPRGDFRASGMHSWYFGALPVEAMRLARRVSKALGMTMLALDMLADPSEQRFSIIEISVFTQIATAYQLQVDGVSGVYVAEGEDFRFVPGTVLTQDLILQELLTAKVIAPACAGATP